jgi:hypothetical protein
VNRIKLFLTTSAAMLLAGSALAHDCAGRIDEFERLLDTAADHAISASSGGQAVAGAREAQAMDDTDGAQDPVPFQEETEEAAEVEEADDAGEGFEQIIEARAALQDARELAESGDEDACVEALDKVILALIQN